MALQGAVTADIVSSTATVHGVIGGTVLGNRILVTMEAECLALMVRFVTRGGFG